MNASSSQSANRPVVLLVDDEPELLSSLRQGLQGEFEIDVAGSAEEAELMVATRHYDVIVCDHLMRGEEGLQFLTRTRERHPRTRRIMMTGYMNPELLSRSVAVADLASCLIKPVHAAELSKAIRDAMK